MFWTTHGAVVSCFVLLPTPPNLASAPITVSASARAQMQHMPNTQSKEALSICAFNYVAEILQQMFRDTHNISTNKSVSKCTNEMQHLPITQSKIPFSMIFEPSSVIAWWLKSCKGCENMLLWKRNF